MRKKLLTIAAILTLAAVSTTILTMTVLAGSGNPGGDESLHPDYSDSDHESNEIVGVPCATGSHTKHVVPNVGIQDVTEHMHHATWYWYDSDADESSPPEERVVKLACGDVPHVDNNTDITSWGNYGTVGWNNGKFTFTGDDDTGFGKYTKLRLGYCNGLIDDGNAGAYSPFEGVPDLCDRYFFDAGEQRPFPSGGM